MAHPHPEDGAPVLDQAEYEAMLAKLCQPCRDGIAFAQATGAESVSLCVACVAAVAPDHQHHPHDGG